MEKYFNILSVNSQTKYSDIKKSYKNKKAEILSDRYLHIDEKNKKLKTIKKAYLKIKQHKKLKELTNFNPFKFNFFFPNIENLKLKNSNFFESKSFSTMKLQQDRRRKIY